MQTLQTYEIPTAPQIIEPETVFEPIQDMDPEREFPGLNMSMDFNAGIDKLHRDWDSFMEEI